MSENLHRRGYCLRLPTTLGSVWILSAFVKTPEYEHRFLLQLIFKKLSARFIIPCFPRAEIFFFLLFSEGHIPIIIRY